MNLKNWPYRLVENELYFTDALTTLGLKRDYYTNLEAVTYLQLIDSTYARCNKEEWRAIT